MPKSCWRWNSNCNYSGAVICDWGLPIWAIPSLTQNRKDLRCVLMSLIKFYIWPQDAVQLHVGCLWQSWMLGVDRKAAFGTPVIPNQRLCQWGKDSSIPQTTGEVRMSFFPIYTPGIQYSWVHAWVISKEGKAEVSFSCHFFFSLHWAQKAFFCPEQEGSNRQR